MTLPTTSTVPAAKTALAALLAARAGLSGVSVLYAWDGTTTPPEDNGERIELDPPDREQPSQSDVAGLKASRKDRDEEYTIVVAIRVDARDEQSPEVTEARVYALFAELEDLLADNGTLGGVLVGGTAKLHDHRRLLLFEGGRWKAQIVAQLECRSRLK